MKSPSSTTKSQVFTKYVGRIEVEPQGQSYLTLGEYNKGRPAKGFSIELHPDPDCEDAVVTEIMKFGTNTHYRLILQVANFGSDSVCAEVWQI